MVLSDFLENPILTRHPKEEQVSKGLVPIT